MKTIDIYKWIAKDDSGKPTRYTTEFSETEEYYDNYNDDERGPLRREFENSTTSSVSFDVRENCITFCENIQKKYTLSMEELYKLVMSHYSDDMQEAREIDNSDDIPPEVHFYSDCD